MWGAACNLQASCIVIRPSVFLSAKSKEQKLRKYYFNTTHSMARYLTAKNRQQKINSKQFKKKKTITLGLLGRST